RHPLPPAPDESQCGAALSPGWSIPTEATRVRPGKTSDRLVAHQTKRGALFSWLSGGPQGAGGGFVPAADTQAGAGQGVAIHGYRIGSGADVHSRHASSTASGHAEGNQLDREACSSASA